MADDAHTPEPAPTPAVRPWWRERTALPGLAALAVSVVALGLAAAPYFSGGGGSFGPQVRAYLLNNPELLDEMVQARQVREEARLTDSINAAARANPTLLAADPRDPAFGPENARVTVIEYFDFRCPGCKATAPEVLQLMQAHPDVRFVFKDWPILDRGDPAGVSHYAARAAQAAHDQGKYLPVFRDLMAEGALTPESIDAILLENGVSLPAARAAIQSPETTRLLVDTHTAATALGLQGTPTFFVNGRASPDINPEHIGRMIVEAKRN